MGGARPRVVRLGAQSLASVTPVAVREWDAAVLAEASRRAGERWSRAASTPKRVNAAIRAWASDNERPVASTGRIPTALREAWLEATGGVVPDPRTDRRNLGHTEAAQAYRLLHTGMAQAVADGLIPANPCAIKGASQRDWVCPAPFAPGCGQGSPSMRRSGPIRPRRSSSTARPLAATEAPPATSTCSLYAPLPRTRATRTGSAT